MPSNPYKEELKARKGVNSAVNSLKALNNKGVNINVFIKQILLEYAVSETFVRNWLKFYLETKELRIEGDMLFGGLEK